MKVKQLYVFKILAFSLVIGVFITACYKDTNYDASALIPKNPFALNASFNGLSVNGAPADGYSIVNMIVSNLPVNTDDTANSVLFSTDYGLFTNNSNSITSPWTYTTKPDGSLERIALASLKGTIVPDSAHISATINGVSVIKSLYFNRAYPDNISIFTSSLYIHTSDSVGITIEVDLRRNFGTPSLYTNVDLHVTDLMGKNVGSFSKAQNFSDSSGKCMFQYVLTNTLYTGPLQVTAQVDNALFANISITAVP